MNILSLDEQTLMKEASEMNLQKLRTIIKAVSFYFLFKFKENIFFLEWSCSWSNSCSFIKYDS